jgi:hypothetical protein
LFDIKINIPADIRQIAAIFIVHSFLIGGLEIGSIPLTIGVVMKSVMNENIEKELPDFS